VSVQPSCSVVQKTVAPQSGQKRKRALPACVRDADVLRVPSGDVDPILRPPRLHPERAAGPTLAGEAVTHRDPHGIALRRYPELATAASGLASLHAPILRDGLRQGPSPAPTSTASPNESQATRRETSERRRRHRRAGLRSTAGPADTADRGEPRADADRVAAERRREHRRELLSAASEVEYRPLPHPRYR
jgi:hypothetical protein